MKLYAPLTNTRALKIKVAAEINGIPLELEDIKLGEDNKKPEYLEMNPNGRSPVLLTKEGPMFESNAILRYIARLNPKTRLYGKNFLEAAKIDRWMDWYTMNVEPSIMALKAPLHGTKQFDKKIYDLALETIKTEFNVLNELLLNNTYIMGDYITIVDLFITCDLFNQFKTFFYPKYRESFPNIERWFMTIINQPQFLKYQEIPVLCKTEFDPSTITKKNDDNKKKQNKEQKPKEVKEEKKVEKKVEKNNDINEEEEIEKPKKVKNPLDELPKSSMDLDHWKRTYSNYKENDFYGVMKLFYEQYDPKGYTLWLCDYKFDEENTVGFKTANLVGGFIQRTEELRKYSFGSMVIMKKEGVSHFFIRGAWMIRGTEIQPMLDCNPDSEYYNWVKVDLNNNEQKTMFEHYWCATDNINEFFVTEMSIFK